MFKDLTKFDIRNATLWVDMPELGAEARILIAPATEDNPAYFQAMLAKAGKRAQRLAKTGRISVEDAELNRQEDRELYPLYVIRSWEKLEGDPDTAKEGELDEAGHVVYNRRHAQKLCAILPRELMDRLRNKAATTELFYPEEMPEPPAVEDVAGNSAGGSAGN